MARVRLTITTVTTTAVDLVDEAGLDALSLSAVARQLGVGPSALYTHCDGVEGLRHLVAVAAINNLAKDLRNAAIGNAGQDALAAMGEAYRRFAMAHPGQFASTLRPPDPSHQELTAATELLLEVFTLVFAAMGLPSEDSSRAARSTRSAIHGFLAIEHLAGSAGPADNPPGDEPPGDDFQHLLDTLRLGLLGNQT